MNRTSIIIGCDDSSVFSVILNKLMFINRYNCISAVRISDVLKIAKSVTPSIIIICFRNNQKAITHITSFLKERKIPILCLTKGSENNTLVWNDKCIVLTQPLEFAVKGTYLTSRLNSLLLLCKKKPQNIRSSFAEEAIQKNFRKNEKSLSRYVMELEQKRVTLNDVKSRIKKLYSNANQHTKNELISIVNSIKVSVNDSKHWNDFKLHFDNVSPKFLNQLYIKHPELTPKDIKYCCYLKMNMSNNEIGHVLGINQESVRTHKYRLKKKLELSKFQDLQFYVKSIA